MLRAPHRTLFVAVLLLIANIGALSQDAGMQTRNEIERLQKELKAKPIASSDLSELVPIIENALKDAATNLSAGHLYLSLERLGQAEDLLHGARMIDEKTELVKDSLPAFESEWNAADVRLTAFDREAHARNWSRAPVAIRALAESAQGRTHPLLEGGRGFANSTKPRDGLLYVGEAEGQAAFSSFLYALALPRTGTAFPLRSLLPELQALQEKANAAFQPPRSIEMHPRFIALNGTLKFARELDAARDYAGALYQYLEATRHYGMLEAAAPDAAKQAELRSRLAEELKKLPASRRDDSIAQIFVERASGWLNKPDGAATAPDEWKSVQVMLEQVLPAYSATLKPPPPLQQRAARSATLTLVRWPYT